MYTSIYTYSRPCSGMTRNVWLSPRNAWPCDVVVVVVVVVLVIVIAVALSPPPEAPPLW